MTQGSRQWFSVASVGSLPEGNVRALGTRGPGTNIYIQDCS